MTFKDPEVSKAYHREYKRKLRSGAAGSNQTPSTTSETLDIAFKIRTANDLLDVAERILNEIMADTRMDLAVKARTVSALLNSAIRLVEASTQEARISAIEDRLNNAVKDVSGP